jgi:hypothetical protein
MPAWGKTNSYLLSNGPAMGDLMSIFDLVYICPSPPLMVCRCTIKKRKMTPMERDSRKAVGEERFEWGPVQYPTMYS